MKLAAIFPLAVSILLSGMAVNSFAQPIGEVDTAGTTWYDLQHIGTCGKMIGVDAEGYAHMVWTNALTTYSSPRHIYYNVWDPSSGTFLFSPGGCQVNSSARAGYATMAVLPGGTAFPAFHETATLDSMHAAVGIDSLPRHCGFMTNQPAWHNAAQFIWPKIAQTPDSVLHMATIQQSTYSGDPRAIFYSRGIPQFDADGFGAGIDWQPVSGNEEFMFVDSCMTISVDVAASRHSDRVALGWAHNRDNYQSEIDNDAMIKVSGDGGVTWGPNQNITDFIGGHPGECPIDTFRLYTDMSLLFDESDVLHAAFSARTWYDLSACGSDPYGWISQSGIWHWSEATHNFGLIAKAFYFQTINNGTLINNGLWQLNVQRPSLAIDTSNGYLYCSYMSYDSNCYSNQGFPMADVFISVSSDNGEHWSVGTNVTRTCPGENIPPPGSMSEREPTLAEVVTNGTLHLSYVLDHDAGAFIQNEGVATLNQFIYERIPVDSIAPTPILPDIPIHADSTGFVQAREPIVHAVPEDIQLFPVYPNPFNSVTEISFTLPKTADISLRVYDLLGRQVTTLSSGSMSAGPHRITWDARSVASGLYFLALQSGGDLRIQKAMLVR